MFEQVLLPVLINRIKGNSVKKNRKGKCFKLCRELRSQSPAYQVLVTSSSFGRTPEEAVPRFSTSEF